MIKLVKEIFSVRYCVDIEIEVEAPSERESIIKALDTSYNVMAIAVDSIKDTKSHGTLNTFYSAQAITKVF